MVSPDAKRWRVPYKGAARRATALAKPAGSTVTAVFDDGEEAPVRVEELKELFDFESKEPLHGLVGPLSATEASLLRQQAEELLEAKDAQAAAEWCSAALQRMALQLEGGEQQVLALRGREIWEGHAMQADEAGTSKVCFRRLLESPELRGLMKNSKDGRLQVELPEDEMLPNERVCSAYGGKLGTEQMELHLCRARCWLQLDSAQRAVLDCSCALAFCRLLAPPPPSRAPGFQLTVPLLVLGIAMGVAKQFTVGIVLCAAAFLWDYVAQQRARRSRANADLAKVLAVRGLAKLQQGLMGLANNELRWAMDELGPLEEGSEVKKLRREIRRAHAEPKRRKPHLAPADLKTRTWLNDAVERVRVDGFLSSLNLECHGKSLTLADAQMGNDGGFKLGYMDYCGDGFGAM